MSAAPDDTLRRPPAAREALARIPLYAPDAARCAIDLSDNTNLWGAPPAAARAIGELALSGVCRYPELYSESLVEALAAYAGVDAGAIVTGCGSDDVIDAAIRAFGEPGGRLAHIDPTFTMVPVFARLNGLEPVAVPLTGDFDADADRLLAAGAAVTYLCSPNNPTGTELRRETMERVIAEAEGVVVVDEAYAEFSGRSVADLVASSDRLLVTRTLSKAFGLAGLRVGYGIASPAIVAALRKARGPYKVNVVAERAAVAALRADVNWMRARVTDAVAVRQRLDSALRALGLEPLPSAANFVLVPVAGARAVAKAMSDRGVLVRAFDGLAAVTPALEASGGAALRIGVGPWEQMEAALEALREALAVCA